MIGGQTRRIPNQNADNDNREQPMHYWRRIAILMVLSGMMILLGCGDDEDEGAGGIGDNADKDAVENQSEGEEDEEEDEEAENDEDPDEQLQEPPDDPEILCEMACDRVYATTSDGGCQQVFHHDTGAAMGAAACEEKCLEEDLFRGGEWCVITEAECGSHPSEMIDYCLPSGYHPPHCDHLPAWDPAVEALEEEVVVLVNELRDEGVTCPGTGTEMGPVGPVSMDEHLRCAARLHSMDMAERNFFAHDNPDGEDPFERIAAAGYTGEPAGENIAQGSTTAQGVVDQWLSSDTGHCENMLNAGHNDMGIGLYQDYWTQKFGR